MGGREAGGLSHLLPGYRIIKNPQHRAEVEEFWGLEPGQISPEPGCTAWEMITGLEQGEVGLLWIAATNPVVSMPDLERTKRALLRSPFTVYQECYYPTETSAYAHVLLPAAQWSEAPGTMTNSERRVTLGPQFRTPPGEARADWVIFADVGRRLGFVKQFTFNSAAEVHGEFVQLTKGRPCDMTGISHDRLRNEGPLQWPCPKGEDEGEETRDDKGRLRFPSFMKLHIKPSVSRYAAKRLYTDNHFHTLDGRANFAAYHSRGLAEPPDDNYPFVLTTGRVYGHWHTQTRTGRVEKIHNMYDGPFLEIHPRDAEKLGVQDGDWLEAQSRRGLARFQAKVTKAIAPGTVFVPMHWGALWANQAEANALTHPESCPDSSQPELKACAVQLRPISLESTPSEQPSQSVSSDQLSSSVSV
jgi:ferredoxin-nitrate reductase